MREFTDKDMWMLDDDTYLPEQYKDNKSKEPFFEGRGNHNITQLEDLCEKFKEHTHQQAVIKSEILKRLVKLEMINTSNTGGKIEL